MKYLGVTILIILLVGVAFGAGYLANERKHQVQVANSTLYDLGSGLEILSILHTSSTSVEAVKAIEAINLKHLMLVSKISPSLEELEGTPTKNLCEAISMNNNGVLFINSNKKLVEVVSNYMNSIEGEYCAF